MRECTFHPLSKSRSRDESPDAKLSGSPGPRRLERFLEQQRDYAQQRATKFKRLHEQRNREFAETCRPQFYTKLKQSSKSSSATSVF